MKTVLLISILLFSGELLSQESWNFRVYGAGNTKRIQAKGNNTTFLRKEQTSVLGWTVLAELEKKSDKIISNRIQFGFSYSNASIDYLNRGSRGSGGVGSGFRYTLEGTDAFLNYYFINLRNKQPGLSLSLGIHSGTMLNFSHEGLYNESKIGSNPNTSSYVFYSVKHPINNSDKTMVNRFSLGYAIQATINLDKKAKYQLQTTLERAYSRTLNRYQNISYYKLNLGFGVRI